MGFRRILDDRETMSARDVQQWVHVHRVSIDVDRHDGLRLRGDPRFHLGHIHTPRRRVGIDKDGHAAARHDCHGAGDDCERRHDDFVARLQVKRGNGQLQRHRPVADSDAVTPAAVGLPTNFELVDEVAG